MHKYAKLFHSLFKGLEDAYGQFTITGEKDGKTTGDAWTESKKPVTDDTWSRHLEGKQGLGIVPINRDNKCKWGVIDIDSRPVDIAKLISRVNEFKLPLVVCSSKSGGAHLFLFMKQPIPAVKMRKSLSEIVVQLDLGNPEIFPKQATLRGSEDIGNWLNMPYFSGNSRIGYSVNGEKLTLETFILYAQEHEQNSLPTIDLLANGEHFKDGPPCLQCLAQRITNQGHRNTLLFNMGIYFKKSTGSWKEMIEEFNRKFSPPLPAAEVAGLQLQLEKKEYSYQCIMQPMAAFCNETECLKRPFGIQKGEEQRTIGPMTRVGKHKPLLYIAIGAERVETVMERLLDQRKFRADCLEQINWGLIQIKQDKYDQLVNSLFKDRMDVEEDESTNPDYILYEHIVNFCRNKSTPNKAQILHNKVWMDKEYKRFVFRLDDLVMYLKIKGFTEFNKIQISERIKFKMNGGNERIRIASEKPYVEWIPWPEEFEPINIKDTSSEEDGI